MMLTVSAEATDNIGNSPVRTWGEYTSVYRYREVDSGEQNSSNWLNEVTFNASSYIWYPWFALFDGSLSLAVDETSSEDDSDQTNTFTSGGLRFNLFPSSRFPFMIYANRNRSEFDDIDFTRRRTVDEYGFSQDYQTLDGNHNYRLSYRDNETSDNDQNTKVDSRDLNLTIDNLIGNQSFATDIQVNDVRNQDQEVVNHSLTVRHTSRQQSDFTWNNLLATSRNESDFGQSFSDATTSQYSGLVSWRPRHRKDISMTGSLRLSEVQIDQFLADSTGPQSQIENASLNLNQGLVYQHSDALTVNQSLNLSQTQSGDNSPVTNATESVGVTYSPQRMQLAIGDYGWNAGTGFSNRHGDGDDIQSLSVSLAHSLASDIFSTTDSNLRSNVSQGISHSLDSEGARQTSLDHSFSLGWNISQLNTRSLLRFQASDSRALEGDEGEIQLFNIQYSGDLTINRYSSLSGNLTLQRSIQSFDESSSENTVSNGQVEYNRSRAFNIPRMNFKSKLQLNKQLSKTEQLEEQIRQERPTDLEWENSLLYRVGRLSLELHLDALKQGGRYDYLFRFELRRSFGDL